MTGKIVFFIVFSVYVIFVNCAIALDCLEGIFDDNCTLTTTQRSKNVTEMTTQTAKPVDKPKILDMLAEEEHSNSHSHFLPTVPSSQSPNNNETEEPKGRSLNFTLDDGHGHENRLSNNATGAVRDEMGDLSDVSMDNEDEGHEKVIPKLLVPKAVPINDSLGVFGICEKGGLTYEEGQQLEVGCDSVCTCKNGRMDCAPRCPEPYFKRETKIIDPLCTKKDVEDPCCYLSVCADTETEPLEICSYQNKTYNRGEKIVKGCDELCTCEVAGNITCKPRCAPINKSDDRCVEVPDENDTCCKKVLCDVTLDDHEPEKESDDAAAKIKLTSAKFLNATTVSLKLDTKPDENQTLPLIEMSADKTNWKTYKILQGGYVIGFKPPIRYVRLENSDHVIEIQKAEGSQMISSTSESETKGEGRTCEHKGEKYKIGEEFNDGCDSLCVCKEGGVKCLKIECPTYFGVDVIDPNCIEWETVPANFTPSPPNCCPQEVRCKNNGSCNYKGAIYNNWQQLPFNVTGCEKRCFCEMGKVECHDICPPVSALPPANLECPPHQATLNHLPDDDCCLYWVCNPNHSSEGLDETVKSDQNGTKKETDMSYTDPFIAIPTKAPSKLLGPLAVYTNKGDESVANLPNVTADENPYYVKENANNKVNVKTPVQNVLSYNPKKSDPKTKSTEFPPMAATTPKPSKIPQKTKPNKTNVFVTPPSNPQENQNHIGIEKDNFYPPPEKHIPPHEAHIQIHGKGNPEDILQIINQHPELANYPHGSVLEIQTVPQKPQFIHHPQQHHRHQNVQSPELIPYVINDGYSNHPNHNQLPPGFTLEQLLQEIHKAGQPQPAHPFIPLAPQLHNNGQAFVAQNGPVVPARPTHNLTYKGGVFPGAFPNVPGFQQPQEEINVQNLEAVDAHTVRLAFTVPPFIVGLHGRVEVRYTHRQDDDPNSWERQVFAPPNDLIATPQLEFDLLDLKPDTEYKIKITITMRDVHNTPSSRVYTIKTPRDIPASTLPPMIPIEPDMAITDINATWVNVVWRKFTEYELQFIDGVQLRFKEIDGKIYAATPLIHRAVTSYTLENLKPNSKYEIGIFFIPFPGQLTELHAEHMLHFTTANEIDTYGFNVTLDIAQIKATTVEVMWSGVPYPEDKYVNIYRAVYQSESGKGDFSTFKIAKRDSPARTMIKDLKPGTRYMLWLEIYLTNGKIKTSNVKDFITKPRSAPALDASTHQDKLAAGEFIEHKGGDYYGPLVIVAILAAIAILSTLILLLILLRRHSQNKAAITPPTRVSQSAYDNPTYKVEIQQETMGL